jgi:hypothetical protein
MPYVGPNDVVAGASHWWGLRAASAAAIGSNCVRLRRISDNVEQDFVTLTDGSLDVASITTFKGASTVVVAKLYDQIGSVHLGNTTVAHQPELILNAIGTLPVMRFVSATPNALDTSSTFTVTQPMTYSGYAKRTGNTSNYNSVAWHNTAGGDIRFGMDAAANSAFCNCGNFIPGFALTDNAFHAYQFACNGASSDFNLDGTANSINAGTYAGNGSFAFGASVTGTAVFEGDMTEVGVWPSAFSGASSTAMSSNQHTYWSIPSGITLTAATGTVTETGIAASLTLSSGLTLIATTGTFTETGEPATLAVSGSIVVSAGAGTYALTGYAAGLSGLLPPYSPPAGESCGNCKYCVMNTRLNILECHFDRPDILDRHSYPQSFQPNNSEFGGHVWPTVGHTDWCGKWAADA